MRISAVPACLSLLLLCVLQASAQTRPAPDPGVNPVRQIDRAEVRVTRVELQPGAVRSVHTHDDVRFHLFIPIQGKLELTIGSAKPVEALPGQVFFMERGTPHGFRNAGTTPAAVMEVFVKDGGAAAQGASGQGIRGEEAQAVLEALGVSAARFANLTRQVPAPQ
ncbi:MAG TPA: cupin domain-containing protein [Verrucomicrobiae bacterium]|jgi:quercetin dioxygenase-like cupin family protein|nr:cupin domain-containing protein [Verrucomicrobiae bacterium]